MQRMMSMGMMFDNIRSCRMIPFVRDFIFAYVLVLEHVVLAILTFFLFSITAQRPVQDEDLREGELRWSDE